MSVSESQKGNLGYGEELALFERPVIDGGVEKVRWIEYRPVNQLTPDSAVEFVINGNGSQYIDLRRTLLHVKARVVQGDDTPLPVPQDLLSDGSYGPVKESAKVGPVNLWLHSLFSQVDVLLQQKLITSSSSTYFIKAYIDTVVLCCSKSKESSLQAQLYYKDRAQHMEDTDSITGSNLGLLMREQFTRQSRIVDMEGPLRVDICQCDRYILNGIELRLKLWPTKSALNLMASSREIGFKTVIEEAVLKVCHITPSPQMLTAHQEILNKNMYALYPYVKCDIKKFTIAQGAYDFTKDDIFQNQIPTRVIIGFVNNEAISGSYHKNPFNFQHYLVNFVEISVDGESVPGRALQTKFGTNEEDGNYIAAFLSMSRAVTLGNETHSISRADYSNGYTFFVFDLEPEIHGDSKAEDDEFWPMSKRGHLRIEVHFDVGLPETISTLVYGEFPKIIKVDHARNILLE
jgi:hypothetical protein